MLLKTMDTFAYKNPNVDLPCKRQLKGRVWWNFQDMSTPILVKLGISHIGVAYYLLSCRITPATPVQES